MSLISLSIATEAYDRVQSLKNGTVTIAGCEPSFLTLPPEELFLRAFDKEEFDVCELSMSSYLRSVDLRQNHYLGIPVFISRMFRHSAIYINDASGITEPRDLIGKRVGVPEYQVTAALWVRGMLEDEYQVAPADLIWFRGGIHKLGRKEKLPLNLPDDISVTDIGENQTLDAMLRNGEIDALITPRVPNSFADNASGVRRLFANYREEEQRYYDKTGFFPIMHVLAIRRSLAERYEWLPTAVYEAFCLAQDETIKGFSDVTALRVTLPWFAAELEETRKRMGEDFWPAGIDKNRDIIEKMLDYAYRHGTISRKLTIDELFAAIADNVLTG